MAKKGKNRYIKVISVEIQPTNKEDRKWLRTLLVLSGQMINRLYLLYQWYGEKMFPEEVTPQKVQNFMYHQISDDERFSDIPAQMVTTTNMAIYQKYKDDIKKGANTGKKSFANFKKSQPLHFSRQNCPIYQEGDDYILKLTFGHTYKLYFGNDFEGFRLFKKLINFEDNMKFNSTSSITYLASKDKYFLKLSYDLPPKVALTDTPQNVMAIDFGMANFAAYYLSTTEKTYVINDHKSIRAREHIKREIRRVKSGLKTTKSGHGRNCKLKRLDYLANKESNFVDTETSQIISKLINVAKMNNVDTIKTEFLSSKQPKTTKDKYVASHWGVMGTIDKLKAKAKDNGITVLTVDPYFSSQRCGFCGAVGLRNGRHFTCTNPKCVVFDYKRDADRNASINIAKSTEYVTKVEETKYYKINHHCSTCGEKGNLFKKTFTCENEKCTMFGQNVDAELNASINYQKINDSIVEYDNYKKRKANKPKRKLKKVA